MRTGLKANKNNTFSWHQTTLWKDYYPYVNNVDNVAYVNYVTYVSWVTYVTQISTMNVPVSVFENLNFLYSHGWWVNMFKLSMKKIQ